MLRADHFCRQAGTDIVGWQVDVCLTVKEAAARLRVSTATVYGLCERGRAPYVRISTHAIRIAQADLSAFVRGRRSSEA